MFVMPSIEINVKRHNAARRHPGDQSPADIYKKYIHLKNYKFT